MLFLVSGLHSFSSVFRFLLNLFFLFVHFLHQKTTNFESNLLNSLRTENQKFLGL